MVEATLDMGLREAQNGGEHENHEIQITRDDLDITVYVSFKPNNEDFDYIHAFDVGLSSEGKAVLLTKEEKTKAEEELQYLSNEELYYDPNEE